MRHGHEVHRQGALRRPGGAGDGGDTEGIPLSASWAEVEYHVDDAGSKYGDPASTQERVVLETGRGESSGCR